MIEQEWMKFERTGRIEDYLAYSKVHETGYATTDYGRNAKEREKKDGADHYGYRYGVGSYTHRGL